MGEPMDEVVGDERYDGSMLVVLLHGAFKGCSSLDMVAKAVKDRYPQAKVLRPEMPLGMFSSANLDEEANAVAWKIDNVCRQAEVAQAPFENILIVGYSAGGLIARKVYAIACGETPEAPFEPDINFIQPAPWAAKVKRIVLLAGMNMGWSINHQLDPLKAIGWSIGAAAGRFLELVRRRPLALMQIRRGASFVTRLRLQWVRMRNRAAANAGAAGNAQVVQLLGTVDDMVAPDDNIDAVSAGDFIFLDVPQSGHANVVDFDDKAPLASDPGVSAGNARKDVFLLALSGNLAKLRQAAILPDDRGIDPPNKSVTDVIFVLHGIRDRGYWTNKVAQEVRKLAKKRYSDTRNFATETSSYGYFPMLPFLFRRKRREKVEWLMDQYVQDVAKYPNARFHFIGHSNGTYCLARALELYSGCVFENVIFAGSVVRTGYDWDRLLNRPAGVRSSHGRVGAVLNYVATADWVVAFFPKTFQGHVLPQDLGSAGHDGFQQRCVKNVKFVSGGHSAALVEGNWGGMAEFIVNGPTALRTPNQILRNGQNWVIKLLGLVPGLVVATLLVLLVWGGMAIWHMCGISDVERTLLEGAYVWLVWFVMTRL